MTQREMVRIQAVSSVRKENTGKNKKENGSVNRLLGYKQNIKKKNHCLQENIG